MTQPFRDAGFVVMEPAVRGENGQPGSYSMFYDEVTDVMAAADYLAQVPYVDPTRMFVAGHSVGGTLTLLAALSTDRFRAAASFSGSPDQVAWSRGQTQLVPFNPSDTQEFRMRSPIAFATEFKCPTRVLCGSEAAFFVDSSVRMAELAQKKGLDVAAIQSSGDHFSAVPEEMRRTIEFFRNKL